MSTNDSFMERVNYAARTIAEGRDTSCNRSFFNCFENFDGDYVITALHRRSLKNPRLAANLYRYLRRDSVEQCVAEFGGLTPRQLRAAAEAHYAQRCREVFGEAA